MPVNPKSGRGRNVWRVTLRVDGRQREWTIRGTKAEARAFEARRIQELEVGAVGARRVGPKFSDFCLGPYAKHAAMHLRASTWSVRRYHIATLIEHFGERRLTAIRTDDVEEFKAKRLEAGRRPRSINNELAVLQAIRAYARALPVPIGQFKVIALPVVGRGRVTFWNDEQLAQLFASVQEHAPELLGVVTHLANTGCRKGEALAAEAEWIDLKRRLVRIPVNEFWQPKDNEPRDIPISDALLPWITSRVRAAERRAAKRKAEGLEPGRLWLFPSRTGERFAVWPKLQFDRARKLAGRCTSCRKRRPKAFTRCPSCAPALRGGPHTLRHTFAAHFLAARPDMYLLAQVLGHSETRTTKLYAHLLPGHLERARNAVNIAPAIGPAKVEAGRRWKGRARP